MNNGIDWQGLLKWSLNYHDGTAPSNFQPMSKEDQDWLEAAMKECCVNDVDRISEIIKILKQKRSNPPEAKENLDLEEINELLEELMDHVELHPRNNLNLCIMGGMIEILALAFGYPDELVRRNALQIITTASANNLQVQEYAMRSGAMNLVESFCNEKNLKNLEAIFSALSAVIKSDNFTGKLKFIKDFNGLEFLESLLCDELAADSIRLYRRVLILINDLVINDDMIDTSNPLKVRTFFAGTKTFVEQLLKNISSQHYAADLTKN